MSKNAAWRKRIAQTGVLASIAISIAVPCGAATHAKVKVSPNIGHPSTAAKVGGGGFAKSEAVDIYFDTTDEALAVTNDKGKFTAVPLTVPAGATPGTHWVTAIGRKDGVAAQTKFTVQTDWVEHGFGSDGKRTNLYENV